MRSFVIIAHADSGGGRAQRVGGEIQGLLVANGAKCEVVLTSKDRPVEEILGELISQSSSERPCVVVCGGDGAIQHCVNAVMEAGADELPLGIAATGTCNDFAHALGIGRTAEQIVEVLLRGEERRLELIKAGSRYFCTIAVVGLESLVIRFLVDRVTKSPTKWLFVVAAGLRLLVMRPLDVRLVVDGKASRVRALNVLIANTKYYGGNIRIAPTATPVDGEFELVVFKAMGLLRSLITMPMAVLGKHLQRTDVSCERGRSVTIERPQPSEVWADGEPIGRTPIEFRVVPDALRVLVPRQNDL